MWCHRGNPSNQGVEVRRDSEEIVLAKVVVRKDYPLWVFKKISLYHYKNHHQLQLRKRFQLHIKFHNFKE